MELVLPGTDLNDPRMQTFHKKWLETIEDENARVSGIRREASPMQKFIVDMCCGNEAEFNVALDNHAMVANSPPQMELEALFRARNMVLAWMLSGGHDDAPHNGG